MKNGGAKKIDDGFANPQERYRTHNIQRLEIKLNRRTDDDIIGRLETVDNKQGYIKQALRKYISQEPAK